jgi:UDP-N-acetylglucosamine--N-acetylmuramyl-(pentapeptide) pyrophosphoryl-undecaprenol N-acetylglucosamine transferase
VKSQTILLAAGGTGGHVFPALAVADALTSLATVDIVFVGSSRGLERRIVPSHGYRLELIEAAPMKGGGPARAVRGATVAAFATMRAVRLVKRLAPRVVLSVGGYSAGPVALAATLLRIPVAVLEPNATLGLANRLLAPLCKRGYVAWQEVASRFPEGRARLFGVPLRSGFVARPYADKGTACVLVLGGSQGADALNRRVPEAMARVAERVPALEVVHQAGRDREEAVRAAYAREGVPRATVLPFIEDVAKEIAAADLVVARAGATTIAEILAIGRPAILIPFPHAADDHQAKNALAAAGAAVTIRQEAADAVRIAMEVTSLFEDPTRRAQMAEAARALGRPSAAVDVAEDLLALAGLVAAPRTKTKLTNGHTRPGPATEAR